MSTIVVAPDSFKGTLCAAAAARQIAEGWSSVRPLDEVLMLPQADGGEGTLDAIEGAIAGARRRSAGMVTGPDGRPTPGEWLELPGSVAVIELAQASGLPLMRELDAEGATTRGTGEVIRAALHCGARSIVLGLGGSASTDGGAGALSALGLCLMDAAGRALPDGGGPLGLLNRVDRTHLITTPPGGVTLLTDVAAPLLGPAGAAAVFGPQKGARAAQVELLDVALARFASMLGGDPSAPGAGAAGGSGFGFASIWDARIIPGAEYIAELTGLPAALDRADLLLTGEGLFDDQSLGGKVVGHLLALAAERRVAVGVIAGELGVDPGVWSVSLTTLAGSAKAAMADAAHWLWEAGAATARELG